ncbi:hypothetical protein CDIK_3834, partial [Cucumispora dikerogammari]
MGNDIIEDRKQVSLKKSDMETAECTETETKEYIDTKITESINSEKEEDNDTDLTTGEFNINQTKGPQRVDIKNRHLTKSKEQTCSEKEKKSNVFETPSKTLIQEQTYTNKEKTSSQKNMEFHGESKDGQDFEKYENTEHKVKKDKSVEILTPQSEGTKMYMDIEKKLEQNCDTKEVENTIKKEKQNICFVEYPKIQTEKIQQTDNEEYLHLETKEELNPEKKTFISTEEKENTSYSSKAYQSYQIAEEEYIEIKQPLLTGDKENEYHETNELLNHETIDLKQAVARGSSVKKEETESLIKEKSIFQIENEALVTEKLGTL